MYSCRGFLTWKVGALALHTLALFLSTLKNCYITVDVRGSQAMWSVTSWMCMFVSCAQDDPGRERISRAAL